MQTDPITLNWLGPYEFETLYKKPKLGNEVIGPGVYIWERRLKGAERPLVYAGRANNIWERLRRHICFLLGGLYSLHKPDGERTYTPDRCDYLRGDIDSFSVWAVEEAKTSRFYYALCEKEHLKRCEGALLKTIKEKGTELYIVTTRVESDGGLVLSHQGDCPDYLNGSPHSPHSARPPSD